MKTAKVLFYSYYAPYLINHETDSYSDEEIEECDRFFDIVYQETGMSGICTCGITYSFGRPSINDDTVPGYLAGDLMEYTVF